MVSINDIKKKYYDRLSNNKDVMKVYNAVTEEFIAHTMKESRDLDEIINNIVEGTKEYKNKIKEYCKIFFNLNEFQIINNKVNIYYGK